MSAPDTHGAGGTQLFQPPLTTETSKDLVNSAPGTLGTGGTCNLAPRHPWDNQGFSQVSFSYPRDRRDLVISAPTYPWDWQAPGVATTHLEYRQGHYVLLHKHEYTSENHRIIPDICLEPQEVCARMTWGVVHNHNYV